MYSSFEIMNKTCVSDPHKVQNCDKTGLQDVSNPRKVLNQKREKAMSIVAADKGNMVTVLGA